MRRVYRIPLLLLLLWNIAHTDQNKTTTILFQFSSNGFSICVIWVIISIESQRWRLDNAKSPATILQENNPDATRVSIHSVCTWYFAEFAMYTYACLEACDYRAFVASMTNRHGHWVCWTSAYWMSMGVKNTASKPRGTCA